MFFQDSFQSCWKICLECWVNPWTCVTNFIKVWPLLFKVSLDFTLVWTNGVNFLKLYSFPRKLSRGMKVGSIKGVNIVPEVVSVWPMIWYILDTDQYQCTVSDLPLFFTILYNIQNYISNNSIYHFGNFLYFFMELST